MSLACLRVPWPTVHLTGLRSPLSDSSRRAPASGREEELRGLTSNPSIFDNAIGRNHEQTVRN